MREIKFRAWNKDKKVMESYPMWNDSICHWFNFPSGYEVMQYTGLEDEDMKEIYEGDIFIYNNNEMQGEVYFDGGSFCIKYGYKNPTNKHRKDYFLSGIIGSDRAERIKVIGNIYENPELLK